MYIGNTALKSAYFEKYSFKANSDESIGLFKIINVTQLKKRKMKASLITFKLSINNPTGEKRANRFTPVKIHK